MKANDLMIGDWVHVEAHRGFNAQNVKVEAIPDNDSDNEYGHHYGHIGAWLEGGDNDFRDVEARHLQPIPLTAQILEINGFEQVKEKWVYSNDYYDITIYEWSDSMWVWRYESTEMNIPYEQRVISYLNELQHAFKECGIEKDFVL